MWVVGDPGFWGTRESGSGGHGSKLWDYWFMLGVEARAERRRTVDEANYHEKADIRLVLVESARDSTIFV